MSNTRTLAQLSASRSSVRAPLAGSHQQRPGVRRPRRSDVAHAIADHRHPLQAVFQPPADFQQHTRIGLAEGIGLVHVRTEEHRVDQATDFLHHPIHLLVDPVEGFQIEQAASDPGLVGGDDHPIAHMVEAGDGFQTAGHRRPFVRGFDVGVGILVDNAVTVQNDQFHRGRGTRVPPCGGGRLVSRETSCVIHGSHGSHGRRSVGFT